MPVEPIAAVQVIPVCILLRVDRISGSHCPRRLDSDQAVQQPLVLIVFLFLEVVRVGPHQVPSREASPQARKMYLRCPCRLCVRATHTAAAAIGLGAELFIGSTGMLGGPGSCGGIDTVTGTTA